MPKFVKGLDLSQEFFNQIVKPILEKHDRDLDYAAGLIGHGSEVLGYDDRMSTDHDWGPSVTIFLPDGQDRLIAGIKELMRHELPHHFRGFSTNFISSPEAPDVKVMAITTRGAINHHVKPVIVSRYFQDFLKWNPYQSLSVTDWLTFPSQKLRAITEEAIFHDGFGDITKIRARLAWYPGDVWLLLMAVQWYQIGEDEHLMGRADYRGDMLGGTVIANRLVQSMMRLGFLIEKQYAPYPKWFGTAFNELAMASVLIPMLRKLQLAEDWQGRQSTYAQIVEFMLDQHNQLNITPRLNVKANRFHTRPFFVADGGAISGEIKHHITDPHVRALFMLPSPVGNIDQITDDTGLREFPAWRKLIKGLYAVETASASV